MLQLPKASSYKDKKGHSTILTRLTYLFSRFGVRNEDKKLCDPLLPGIQIDKEEENKLSKNRQAFFMTLLLTHKVTMIKNL